MASEKNITMRQYNGADYDTLYPKTKVEQVEGAYTQQQILSDSTKGLYGLETGAMPDDVLALLGPCVQYWWSKWIVTYSELRATGTKKVYIGYAEASPSYTLTYASSISFSNDGDIIFNNPATFTVNSLNIAPIKGKYIRDGYWGSEVYYVSDNTPTTTDNGYYYVYGYLVNSQKSTSEHTYVHSADRNAYPDSGIVDYIEYAFLGKPMDNAVGAAQIVYGTYTGTGTYGSSNPNTLNFDHKPLLLAIMPEVNSGNAARGFLAVRNSAFTYTYPGDFNSINTVTWTDRGVSWYCADSAAYQFNSSDVYHYVALLVNG